MATITRFDPFRTAGLHDEVERMFREVAGLQGGDRDAPATAGAFSPALDVREHADEYTLYVELPGVDADDVEITLEENVLTIAGERSFYDDVETDEFRRVERRFGRYHRAVRLPDRVDGTAVSARYRDGVLTIRVPKAEEAKPRRIAIEA
ncbi:Hsp20/alpha crystallin family protein [Salsipaludibacter albus]|uniref:Hsp20/alpha crystallin family protein n=1 Tax=Salsipaludibacter albus TaxID=2849650 RepID=UPI001EE4E829|nr:Hsp20/alpha crystallin family protein [Salsipaludibacter albus]MBY5161206.1 Hsp20/alpha crystallin family protein [Salsipaludibacter albus]